jgi:hypothetical protein
VFLSICYLASFNANAVNFPRDRNIPECMEVSSLMRARLANDDTGISITIERDISREDLSESKWYREFPDGTKEEVTCLKSRVDLMECGQIAHDIASALTLLLDVPLAFARAGRGDHVVAETDQERQLLRGLGSNTLCLDVRAERGTSAYWSQTLTSEQITGVLGRSVGLRLYSDALHGTRPTSQFRDYWRVLESAFRAHEEALVDLLANYPPALELHFTRDELQGLLIIRNRASHANSRAGSGLREVIQISRDCTNVLPRVKSLAKRVILTKKSWGYPAIAVEEVPPFARTWCDESKQYW